MVHDLELEFLRELGKKCLNLNHPLFPFQSTHHHHHLELIVTVVLVSIHDTQISLVMYG